MTSIAAPSVSRLGDIPQDVRPHPHDPTLWQVLSRSRGDEGLWHDVDVLNEACSCAHFQWRLDDKPQGTITAPNQARWCYHLRLVMTMPARDLVTLVEPAPEPAAHDEPTTLICASCGHETYALVDDGICAACSFFDDGSRPFRQVAEEGQATHAAPLPEPIPLVRERRCPDCDRPSLDDTIYCTVSRFGRGYCAHRSARREEASI
jgi:ribosomal protein L37E